MLQVSLKLGLPSGAIWQVAWFGTLEQIPSDRTTWAINVFFKEFEASASVRLIRRVVSLAHMHLLPIGRCVDGNTDQILGVTLISQQQQRNELRLDLAPENTTLIWRSGLPPSRAQPCTASRQYDGALLLVRPSGDCPGALIPCATLFQFFWGVSSRIFDLVMTGKLEQPERHVYLESRSSIDPSGNLRLTLRETMLNHDGPYLAALYAEPASIEAGRLISRKLAALRNIGREGDVARLEVTPPFARPMTLLCFSQVVPAKLTGLGRDLPFISHIVSSDLQPAWTTLELWRENDNRRGTLAAEDALPMDRVPVPNVDRDGSLIDLHDVPAGHDQESADLPILHHVDLKFPALAAMPVRWPEKPTTTYKHVAVKVTPIADGRSAIEGNPAPTNNFVLAGLAGGLELAYDDDEVEVGEPPATEPVHSRLAMFANMIAGPTEKVTIGSESLKFARLFMHPYASIPSRSPPVYFDVPSKVGDETIAWLYRDPQRKLRKRAFCVELTISNEDNVIARRYVVDFEPRSTRAHSAADAPAEVGNGFLVVWNKTTNTSGELSKAQIKDVIIAVAKRGNPKLSTNPHVSIGSRSFRHVDDLGLQKLALRVFAATDQTSPNTPS